MKGTRNPHEENCRLSNVDQGSVMLLIMPLVENRANTPLSDRALSATIGRPSEGRGFFPIPQQIKLRQHPHGSRPGMAQRQNSCPRKTWRGGSTKSRDEGRNLIEIANESSEDPTTCVLNSCPVRAGVSSIDDFEKSARAPPQPESERVPRNHHSQVKQVSVEDDTASPQTRTETA